VRRASIAAILPLNGDAQLNGSYGNALREWRGKRKLSQLDLSLCANVSARHIAFLETGRSRPSRAMVMHLGEALEVPRGERNRMLDAAGFRPAWVSRPLSAAELDPVRRAIARVTDRHDPYPALVVDRHWNIVSANRSGALVLAAFGVADGDSILSAMLEPGRAETMIENWPEVAAHTLARLRTESAHLGGDAILDEAASQLARDPALLKAPVHADMPAIVPTRYRLGGQIYSVFGTIAQFGTAEDIALADLRIELLFPADEATRALLEQDSA
jgi:transcriptional regulator with XRE-family HTH domain